MGAVRNCISMWKWVPGYHSHSSHITVHILNKEGSLRCQPSGKNVFESTPHIHTWTDTHTHTQACLHTYTDTHGCTHKETRGDRDTHRERDGHGHGHAPAHTQTPHRKERERGPQTDRKHEVIDSCTQKRKEERVGTGWVPLTSQHRTAVAREKRRQCRKKC